MNTFRIRLIMMGFLLLSLVGFFSLNVISATLGTPTISKMDVFDADIREIFRSLGELGNLSVLLDPDVKGNTTIGLKEGLTVQEAIELLAHTYGYSCRWLESTRTVVIGSAKTFVNFDTLETRVYHFNYAQTDQVIDALKNTIPADKIGIDKRTNQLTITASLLQHQNIEEMVKRLDREMPQITVEIRVEEIQKSVLESTGVLWAMGGNGATTTDMKIDFSKPALTVDMLHYLQLWEQNSQAKLLSNPKIATTDSQEGSVFIGDKYPVVTTSESNGVTTYNVTYIDMGTKLSVTPRINESDIVTVNVKANVSSFSAWAQAGADNKIPVVRNRDISSVIRLRDGETFVLSGLSEVRSVETNSGVKGLSKIPLIGWLFKNKTTDPKSDTEVCIFITPKIIRLTKDTDNNTSESKANPTEDQKGVTQVTVVEQKPTGDTSANNSANSQQVGSDGKKSETGVPATETKKETQNLTVPEQKANQTTTVISPKGAPEETPQGELVATPDPSMETTEQIAGDDSGKKTVIEVTPTPTPQESPIIVKQPQESAGPKVEAPKYQYIVKQGDTISAVAKKFGVNANDILQKNALAANTKLLAGKTLNIPVPQSHIYHIKPKETLWRIAKRYGVNIQVLQEINRIADITKVSSGQGIILPLAVDQVANSSY